MMKSIVENPATLGIPVGMNLTLPVSCAILFSRVLLPLPLAPQSMMQSPEQMSKEISRQRSLPGNSRLNLFILNKILISFQG
jgi:hypothetical protein